MDANESAVNNRQTSIRMNVRWIYYYYYCAQEDTLSMVVATRNTIADHLFCVQLQFNKLHRKLCFVELIAANYDRVAFYETGGHSVGLVGSESHGRNSKRNFWCDLFNFSHHLHTIGGASWEREQSTGGQFTYECVCEWRTVRGTAWFTNTWIWNE